MKLENKKSNQTYLADQLDLRATYGSTSSITNLQINCNIYGSHYNTCGSNNVGWVYSNRFKCSRDIFVFSLWVLGAAAVMLGAPSNTQIMLMVRLGLALLDMLLNVLAAQTLPLLESVSGHEVNFDSCMPFLF